MMMITSVQDWFTFLTRSDTLLGFPLLVGGVVLLLFGWRLWRVCAVLSFALIGAALGAKFAPSENDQVLLAVTGAVMLGTLSYWSARHSMAILGGIIGLGLVVSAGWTLGFAGLAVWLVGGVALFGCSALAYISRKVVVIGVTAVWGTVLLMSGLTILATVWPAMYDYFHAMATSNAIVYAFMLLVPTVVSCFYQAAETSRLGVEL